MSRFSLPLLLAFLVSLLFAQGMIGQTNHSSGDDALMPTANKVRHVRIDTSLIDRMIITKASRILLDPGDVFCLSGVPSVFKNGLWWAWASPCDGHPWCWVGTSGDYDRGMYYRQNLFPSHIRKVPNYIDPNWTPADYYNVNWEWVSSNGWRYATEEEWPGKPVVYPNGSSEFGSLINFHEPVFDFDIPSVEVCAAAWFDPYYYHCDYYNGASTHVSRVLNPNPSPDNTIDFYSETWYVHNPCDSMYSTRDSAAFSYSSKWNLVALPYLVFNSSTAHIYPAATSGAFSYDGTYSEEPYVLPGKGYWLSFPETTSVQMMGYVFDNATIDLNSGWNLIGSISSPIAASSVTTHDSTLTVSGFYGYSNGYYLADTLLPGRGYWVSANQAGSITLSAAPVQEYAANRPVRIVASAEAPPPSPDGEASATLFIPIDYVLDQAYPNPFNPSTTIRYHLPAESNVRISIHNALGQEVAIVVDGHQNQGYHSCTWNAAGFASGLYFYRLTAVNLSEPNKLFAAVKKLMLLR